MRRSLWTRLMGVFLGVIVVGVITMVIAIRLTTSTHLQRRVLSDDVAQANALANLMTAYYAQQGSWSGVDEWLADTATRPATQEPTAGMGPGMMGDWMSRWFQTTRSTGPLDDRVILLNAAGEVIADTGGASLDEQHPAAHLQEAAPIVVNGQTVGSVLVGSMIEPALNPADEDFLQAVNLSIFITAAAGGLVALILGSMFFCQITSPPPPPPAPSPRRPRPLPLGSWTGGLRRRQPMRLAGWHSRSTGWPKAWPRRTFSAATWSPTLPTSSARRCPWSRGAWKPCWMGCMTSIRRTSPPFTSRRPC